MGVSGVVLKNEADGLEMNTGPVLADSKLDHSGFIIVPKDVETIEFEEEDD